MIYINNLWLLPAFLRKKLYKDYLIRLTVLIIGYAFILTYYNYLFDKYFPLAEFSTVSNGVILGSDDLYKDTSSDIFYFFETVGLTTIPLAIFILIFSMGWFMNDYFIQQKRLDNAIKEKLESELALIKHQINPHFLFNTLNNLYGLSLVKSDNLPQSILQLSHILRYLVYESSSSLISFEQEKEVMESYINLELLRLSNTKNLTFNVKSDKNYQIPPLLWLPILENVFKHGTRQINNDISVDFNFIIENNCLQIYSRNSFQKHPSKKDEVGGFGIENLKKRLNIIYPEKYMLKETTDNNIYEILIKVNLYD